MKLDPELLISAVFARATRDGLIVGLESGETLSVPIDRFPELAIASSEAPIDAEVHSGGSTLYWPDLDLDLSVLGLLPLSIRTALAVGGVEVEDDWNTNVVSLPISRFLDQETDSNEVGEASAGDVPTIGELAKLIYLAPVNTAAMLSQRRVITPGDVDPNDPIPTPVRRAR